MENERKENKRQFVEDKGQKFYFNEDGKLIVESNKGVWVDGEKFVKMYGEFTCNAKTLGIIIQKFKGCPVEIGNEQNWIHHSQWYHSCEEQKSYCIVGLDKEIKETIDIALEAKKKYREGMEKLMEKVKKFNNLPWWKRMFKKVDVK